MTRFAVNFLTISLLSLLMTTGVRASLPESWEQVGQANLRVLWFDVYRAELHTPSGRFDGYRGPLWLGVEYARAFSSSELVKETEKQLLPFSSAQQRQRWMTELLALWPDVNKGDRLSLLINEQGLGHFFLNGARLGGVSDAEFAPAFVQIWLSPRSEYPQLARQLRGEHSDGD